MSYPPIESIPKGNTRLAVVLSHPIQYYAPWFRWMASHSNFTLKVFYLWNAGVTAKLDQKFGRVIAWDIDLISGYEHEFVANRAKSPDTEHFNGLNNPDLKKRLAVWGPSAILLFGYAYRTHLSLIFNSPAPLIFRGDSHLLGQPKPSWVKKLALRFLYGRFAAITYVGKANEQYFLTFGVPEHKLQFAPHCVNAEYFKPNTENRAAAASLRQELGLDDKRVILFAGKLVPAKQPRELLEAFLSIASETDALVITGDGSEKPGLITLAAQHPDKCVHFLPFANQSEMPARYLLADIFVLPSRGNYETWGLAVNEAMHMEVPCIVSDRVGCQLDLVTEGETGWVFKIGDTQGLSNALKRALQCDRNSMKTSIAERISQYTYTQATDGLKLALNKAISS